MYPQDCESVQITLIDEIIYAQVLRFPVIKLEKDEILTHLYEFSPDVLDSCFSCEGKKYDGKRCRTCSPCTNLEKTLISIVRDSKKAIGLRKWARKKLKAEYQTKLPKVHDVEECALQLK